MSELIAPIDASGETLYRRFVRNMGVLVVGTGGAAALSMLATAINVRALSLTEFGVIVLLQTLALAITGIMTFATQQPLIVLGKRAIADKDTAALSRLFGTALLFDIAASAIGVVAGLTVATWGSALIGLPDAYRSYAYAFAVAVFFMGYPSSNGIFRLFDRFKLLSAIQLGMAAVQLALSAILWWLDLGFAYYAWSLAIVMAATYQLQLIAALRIARRVGVSPHFTRPRRRDPEFREFVDYAWTTSGMGTLDTVRANGDALFVSAVAGVQAAGLYNVAKQVAGLLRKLCVIYALALFPEVAELRARRAVAEARRLRWRMVWLGVAITLASLGVTIAIGEPLLAFVFGAPFAASYWALVILMAAGGLQLVSHTLSMFTQVWVTPKALFYVYVASLTAFVAVIGVLTPAYGIAGAAGAQVAFIGVMIAIAALLTTRAFEAMERSA